ALAAERDGARGAAVVEVRHRPAVPAEAGAELRVGLRGAGAAAADVGPRRAAVLADLAGAAGGRARGAAVVGVGHAPAVLAEPGAARLVALRGAGLAGAFDARALVTRPARDDRAGRAAAIDRLRRTTAPPEGRAQLRVGLGHTARVGAAPRAALL